MSASLSANKFTDVAEVFKHDFTCHQAGGDLGYVVPGV